MCHAAGVARLVGTTHELIIRRAARGALVAGAGVLLAVLLVSGCRGGGGQGSSDSSSKLAERVGCSGSYEAVTTDALGVEKMGNCTFRGYALSLVTFADNGARNNYVCSTCGFDADTETAAIEKAARRFGSRFVAGDRYLVRVPSAAAEQAVRNALG
jgi:hypothetical protein